MKLLNKLRRDAMEWWNNLPVFVEGSKHHYLDRYYPDRGHNSLTGREIEYIYKQEILLKNETTSKN